MKWANNFNEIEETISERNDIRKEMISLINSCNILGKALEGNERVNLFKIILSNLTNGQIKIDDAIIAVENDLPKTFSIHRNDNRVFSKGWAERLVHVQFSRFYNHAVLNLLIKEGELQCTVPNSPTQQTDSSCTLYLAGKNHSSIDLREKLIDAYENGIFNKNEPMIPNHPYCSHVLKHI
jgi:hypothetical protein